MAEKKSRAEKFWTSPRCWAGRPATPTRSRCRQWRGRTDIASIEALEPNFEPFGAFRVRSGSGGAYEVEIRDLLGRTNSCGCIDHRVNGLGTCKHIEGVLFCAEEQYGRPRSTLPPPQGSPRVEVFLQRDREAKPRLGGAALTAEARAFLKPCLGQEGRVDRRF